MSKILLYKVTTFAFLLVQVPSNQAQVFTCADKSQLAKRTLELRNRAFSVSLCEETKSKPFDSEERTITAH